MVRGGRREATWAAKRVAWVAWDKLSCSKASDSAIVRRIKARRGRERSWWAPAGVPGIPDSRVSREEDKGA